MKNQLFLFFTYGLFAFLNVNSSVAQTNKEIQIKVYKNVEFLGFAYDLAYQGPELDADIGQITFDDKDYTMREWYAYDWHIYQEYKQYSGSEHLLNAMNLVDNLWLDYLISLLIQLDDFPNAVLDEKMEESFYLRFSDNKNREEAIVNAQSFLFEMNEFYKEVDFEPYFENYKHYYNNALSQINKHLPSDLFLRELEKFYQKSFDSYNLIPSLTIPTGMGFGLKNELDSKTHIYNAFGPLWFQKMGNLDSLDAGFDNETRLRELSTHEFGHSFVNPLIESLPRELIENTRYLFDTIKVTMTSQGYPTWEYCLNEHFVRAGEIVIAKNLGNKEDALNLKNRYERDLSFIYLPIILIELEKYNSKETSSYEKAVLLSFEKLEDERESEYFQNTTFEIDPKKAVIVSSDIEKFWKAFDLMEDKKNPFIEYIENGSKGLKDFIPYRIESPKNLLKTVKKRKSDYLEIRENSAKVTLYENHIRGYYTKFKKLYNKAVFPSAYFVIGAFNSGGTSTENGIIMGVEMNKNMETIPFIVIHELIHFNQKQTVSSPDLLSQSIMEGAADFLTKLITGEQLNISAYIYGNENEKELCKEFVEIRHDDNYHGWLYGGKGKKKDRPNDLGYWIGYKISESYYLNSENKEMAIKEILNIEDYEGFLISSGFLTDYLGKE